MIIGEMVRRTSVIVAVLCAAMIDCGLAQQVSVENVKADLKEGGQVEIRYDLLGPPDAEYTVSVFVILRSPVAPERRKLEDVTGEVGIVSGTGKGLRIVWNLLAELPKPVAGAEYEFEVTASIRRSGGISWYLYAGAAVLAGGIAYLAIKPPAKEESPGVELPKSIPLPPER